MLDPRLIEEYWMIEQQKTNLAAAHGMTLPRLLQHLNHIHPSTVAVLKQMLQRQVKLLRLMRVKDVVENVIFVQFKPNGLISG